MLPFQGWVFNVIPWLVAIPSSLFSGCLSDHLISQGRTTEAQISELHLLLEQLRNGIFLISLLIPAGFDTASVRKLMQVKYLTAVFLLCVYVMCIGALWMSSFLFTLAHSVLCKIFNLCGFVCNHSSC